MKAIILTGANRGLGRAIHDLLLSNKYENYYKIFISRNTGFNESSNNKISKYISIDLSKDNIDLENIIINSNVKEIIFINNAGVIEPIDQAINISKESLQPAININFFSPIKIIQHLTLRSQELAAKLLILNISSGAANRPIQGWLSYCSGKAAIKMAIDVFVEENSNIDVVHFDPGVMDTSMQKLIRSKTTSQMQQVDIFKEFKKNNTLKSPTIVAKELLSLIDMTDS